MQLITNKNQEMSAAQATDCHLVTEAKKSKRDSPAMDAVNKKRNETIVELSE